MRVQEKMKKFAKRDSTLMIFGRTGTGKELVA
ncbi:sigma 54-interacting transcriptional regulator [Kurthia gibsonii]